MSPYVLIIIGPTASGKSALSENIGLILNGEIINADVGQFYEPLSVGTAKPNWAGGAIKHHLFDIVKNPENISCSKYRTKVIDCVSEIINKNKQPILVGGSSFYVKSLFFPPSTIKPDDNKQTVIASLQDKKTSDLWGSLHIIDPIRAAQIHPNDRYRIERALIIWYETGCLPSEHKPHFSLPFNAKIICIIPPKEELLIRIHARTNEMFYNDAWIQEAKKLMNSQWEAFVSQKGFIGYHLIFEWIRRGELLHERPSLIQSILEQTWQYAKRQLVFLKKLLIDLENCHDKGIIIQRASSSKNLDIDLLRR